MSEHSKTSQKRYAAFIKRLKAITSHYNQFELSRLLGVPQSTLSLYMSDKMRPGYEFFLKLSEKNLDLFWLLTGRIPVRSKEMKLPVRASYEYKGQSRFKKAQQLALLVTGLSDHDFEDFMQVAKLLLQQKKNTA